MASNNLFTGINAIILEPGLGKARKKILYKKLEEKGGVSSETFSSSVTHVLVGGSVKYGRVLSLLKVKEIDKHIEVVQADWLSKCLAEAKLVETNNYRVNVTNDPNVAVPLDSKHETQPPVAEQHTPESSNSTPTKQIRHFKSPVKDSPVKKSPAGKHAIDLDDSDYVESDDGDGHDVATDDDIITTHPPPAKKSKVISMVCMLDKFYIYDIL